MPARNGDRAKTSGVTRLVVILALLLLLIPLAVVSCEEIQSGDTGAVPEDQTADSVRDEDESGDGPGDPNQAQNGGAPTAADESPTGADGAAPVSPALAVAEKVSPSVVTVFSTELVQNFFGQTQQAEGTGSGVIYSDDGYIVTNNHVIESSLGEVVDEIRVRLATGEEFPAEVVGRDPSFDLAVLKIEREDLPAARFLDDIEEVRVGQYAIAIGSPLGESFQNSVTLGIVSGIGREIPAPGRQQQALVDLIQTDAAISPGNSGGALADAQGRVIGINVAYIQPQAGAQDLGFAIPADVVVDVADQLIETGEVRHAYLGIGSISVSEVGEQFDLPVDRGVLVAQVYADTPADEAGLRRGDVIVELDGREIESQADLFSILRRRSPGDRVTVTVAREEGRVELDLVLGERPADFG
ncbi:MAG: hypothetical protein Kow00129_09350 [Thermoleophilia bacterium]